MVDEASRALFFHAAPDSEELCEEALRCHPGPVSTHIYHGALQQPEEHFWVYCRAISWAVMVGAGGGSHTCAVLVAPVLAALKARAAESPDRASMVEISRASALPGARGMGSADGRGCR